MRKILLSIMFFLSLATTAHAGDNDFGNGKEREKFKLGVSGTWLMPVPIPLGLFAEYKFCDSLGIRTDLKGIPIFSVEIVHFSPVRLRFYPAQANRKLSVFGGLNIAYIQAKEKSPQKPLYSLEVGFDYEFNSGFQIGVITNPLSSDTLLVWSYNFARLF